MSNEKNQKRIINKYKDYFPELLSQFTGRKKPFLNYSPSNHQLMEVQTVNSLLSDTPFIVANTLPVTMKELREEHIIPVFTKDNHPLISQS